MPDVSLPDLPRAPASAQSGTVTLLFTDIESSTRLWEQDGARMSIALAAHDALARRAVEARNGTVVKMIGDGMHAFFTNPLDAIAATLELQRALADPAATGGLALNVRCGLHAGVVELRDNDTFGAPVNRAARIMSAAHGGQVLLSQAVADCIGEDLPREFSLRDLGRVRLRDLATPQQLYQLVHPQLRGEFPSLRSLEAIPNNLPQQATSFIGRERELDAAKRLLAATRLLTLTGSGGCGKTRLALQVAADALEDFPDGEWLVELAALSHSRLVAQGVAGVLGLKEEPGRPLLDTIAEHLADRRALLLLDNCEHLLDASAEVAASLLARCAPLKIVATSREALGIGGEQAYRVPSLSLPDPTRMHAPEVATCEAVQLFVERALLTRADFRISPQNAPTLASICTRLDGIPLAIELAAARVRSLSVDEIDSRLNQRFRLLTGGSRTALPRQQTLRSLIDWSYDLLSDPAKRVLERLSVFAGGFQLEAAEKVCAGDGVVDSDVLDLATSLCDKSLVTPESGDGRSRFRLAETVRQYARERLAEHGGVEAVRDRHLDCFVALAEEAEPKLVTPDQTQWLRRLEDEHDNFRAALEWGLAGPESTRALRLCGALQRFWMMRGHLSEGREWCARVLAVSAAAEDELARAKVLNAAGLFAYHQLDYSAARALHEQSLAIRRAHADRRSIAVSLNNLGLVALDQGDLDTARAMHEESLAIAREIGNRNGVARSLGNLGMVAAQRRDYAAAQALFEQSHALLRELGDRDGMAISLHELGDLSLKQGNLDAARGLFVESLLLLRELGHGMRIAYSLEELGGVTATLGEPLQSARLWGAAERLREAIAAPAPRDDAHAARVVDARAAAHDDAAFTRAWDEGRALTLEQAVELAQALAPG